MAAAVPHIQVYVAYTRPAEEDTIGRNYDYAGRVDVSLIEELLPAMNADFYLCGPEAFMAHLRAGLVDRGIAPERIRTETFGSAP